MFDKKERIINMIKESKNRQRIYACFLKSHCSAPDFEIAIEANDKKDAVKKLMKHPSLVELDKKDIERNIFCIN